MIFVIIRHDYLPPNGLFLWSNLLIRFLYLYHKVSHLGWVFYVKKPIRLGIHKAIRRVTHIQAEGLMEANRQFHQDLISGVSIDQDIGARRQKLTARFIDFDNPERNEFLVVNQFWVKGPKQTDCPDIVVFINGIPLVVIECKKDHTKRYLH